MLTRAAIAWLLLPLLLLLWPLAFAAAWLGEMLDDRTAATAVLPAHDP